MPRSTGWPIVINNERECMLEEELLLVRNSGEIPEVALHASLHYLCDEADGPRLLLTDEELKGLQEAALARYHEIILRDLNPVNRDRSLFRGIRRAIANWQRCSRFSEQIDQATADFRRIAAAALRQYLHQEAREVQASERSPSVNCTPESLLSFARELGIEPAELPDGWPGLCEQHD